MKKAFVLLLIAAITASHTGHTATDVVLTAQAEGYTAFHDAVTQAGLYEHAKKDAGEKGSMAPFTVFVPTNEAFATIKDLPADQQKKLITFHVVPGKKIENPAEEMKSGVPTVGEQLLFMADEKIFLEDSENKAGIVKGPIAAKNGVLFVIDHIIAPAGTTLAAAVVPTQAPAPQKVSDDEAPTPTTEATSAPQQPIAPQMPIQQVMPQANAPVQILPIQVAAPQQAGLLTEQTGQILANGVNQLTQSIQLLIHVIQQAQQQVGTPSQAEAVPLTVIP